MNEIWGCLPRQPSRKNAAKGLSQEHNRTTRVSFEPQPCQLRDALTLSRPVFFNLFPFAAHF